MDIDDLKLIFEILGKKRWMGGGFIGRPSFQDLIVKVELRAIRIRFQIHGRGRCNGQTSSTRILHDAKKAALFKREI